MPQDWAGEVPQDGDGVPVERGQVPLDWAGVPQKQ